LKVEHFIVDSLLQGGTVMAGKIGDRPDPKARGEESAKADFERNRDGIYGGLPEARPTETVKATETTRADFDRNRQGIYGGLPEVRRPPE
jgi:hypothetical protein